MRPRTVATLSLLAIIMAMTAVTGCSSKSAASVTSDVGSAEVVANAGASRGLVTVYYDPT